ncbi:DUF2867 domain-containing protein [Dyella sp.]|uniref:DUF2867 domain-containing protein n=1 Tax=Dyella sp. TaxID=1869338 RepID=UPI002ED0FCE8
MRQPIHRIATFPSVTLPAEPGAVPVEVVLVAQLGPGAGDQLYAGVAARQRSHIHFVDALDEPSARIGASHFLAGDPTSLYTFTVSHRGHPFHRHAGHRVFTAVSGSGGAQLRFSSATSAQLADDPSSFFRSLHAVDIPPDCMFTVRFGGNTWHQFASLRDGSRHPTLFALSCHTNELGGDLPESLRAQVLHGDASIPALTELLPPAVNDLLRATPWRQWQVPTTRLALDAPPASALGRFCHMVRGMLGGFRYRAVHWLPGKGFVAASQDRLSVRCQANLAVDSLLHGQLADRFQHQDSFTMALGKFDQIGASAAPLLGRLLDSFVANPPPGVTRLMAIRNILARPFGLRTSPLGCPVSSLLSPAQENLFLGRHPVRAQRVSEDGRHAQVILGANDKHLRFRSCVGVRIDERNHVEITLANRVLCTNLFGHVYMALIESTHRHYVSPAMLRMAAQHAFSTESACLSAQHPH